MRSSVHGLISCLLLVGPVSIAQAQQSSRPEIASMPPKSVVEEQHAEIEAFTASFAATVKAALLNDKCKVLSEKDAERIGFWSVTILETIRGDIGASAANRIIDEGRAWADAQPCNAAATDAVRAGFRAGERAMQDRLGATTADGIDFYELVAADLLIRKCHLFQVEEFNGKHVAVHLAELETAIAKTEGRLESSEAAEIRARTAAKFAATDTCDLRASIIAMIGLFKSEFIRTSRHR